MLNSFSVVATKELKEIFLGIISSHEEINSMNDNNKKA